MATLAGHAAPLLGVRCVDSVQVRARARCRLRLRDRSAQIISLDKDGWLKVWDARTFVCVQTVFSVAAPW